jgi:hypothetical protein
MKPPIQKPAPAKPATAPAREPLKPTTSSTGMGDRGDDDDDRGMGDRGMGDRGMGDRGISDR